MSNLTRSILVEDFYQTTISDELGIPATGDFSVTLATPPSNMRGWIIISPNDSGLRERCYYHNVIGNVIYVKGINRYTAKEHADGAIVQINDVSNIFNYLSQISASTFYVELTGGLNVNIWGGPFLRDNLSISVGDTTLSLNNNATNYIYYKWSTNEIKSNTSESVAVGDDGIITSEVICASGEVSSVSYRNYKACTFTITQGPTGPAGSLGTTGQTQNVNDIILKPTSSTISYSDTELWVKITKADGTYILYTATSNTHPFSLPSGIFNYDAANNLLTSQLLDGTYNATLHAINYTNGNSIEGISGDLITETGEIAYRNQSNIFTGINTFGDDVIFNKRVTFPYHEMNKLLQDIIFDANNGIKQYIQLATTTGVTISFKNLRSGSNYEFAIITSGSTVLNIGTMDNPNTNITKFYTVRNSAGTDFFPLTMTGPDVHLFVCDTFNTALHMAYLGVSRESV